MTLPRPKIWLFRVLVLAFVVVVVVVVQKTAYSELRKLKIIQKIPITSAQ